MWLVQIEIGYKGNYTLDLNKNVNYLNNFYSDYMLKWYYFGYMGLHN